MAYPSNSKNVEFIYTKAPGYKTHYANGVHGGITPRGDIKMDFFIETPLFPEKVINSVTPEGLGPEIDREPSQENAGFERESQTGIMVSPQQAKSIAYWILQHIEKLEQRNSGQSE